MLGEKKTNGPARALVGGMGKKNSIWPVRCLVGGGERTLTSGIKKNSWMKEQRGGPQRKSYKEHPLLKKA